MGGLEKLQNYVYVIYEWSLIHITFMDDTIFVSPRETWTEIFFEKKLIYSNVGNVVEFSGADLNRFFFD